jgi:hypothetical protein
MGCRQAVGVLLAMLVVLSPLLAVEEAWRGDGRSLRGLLMLTDGQLRFQPTEGAAIPSTELRRIRFEGPAPPPFRAGGGRRVTLWDGQRITGQFLSLNKEKLVLRTAWAARLEVPRAAVASLDSLPGWRTVADEDFRDGVKPFMAVGDPPREEVKRGAPARAVILNRSGQRLTYVLAKPLSAGRVGVNFQERERPSGARWTIALHFQQGEQSRRLTATLAGGGDRYLVDADGLKGTARRVARTAGWHRLIVQFTKRSLRLTCDDQVLWYNLDEGPGGPLRQVTIRCQQADEGAAPRGAVVWTEFGIDRAVNEPPRPPSDAEQDEARLTNDDQLFGRILKADRRAVEIEGHFGKRVLSWTQVSGCAFRRPKEAAKAKEKAHVRLHVRSGLCRDPDVLEGVLTALDGQRLVLRHTWLGELTFERSRLRELQPLPSGSK